MRRTSALLAALVLCAARASGQSATTGAPQESDSPPPAAEEPEPEPSWSFPLSAYAYFVPDDSDYVQPTFKADRDWLHLEARYNYEDIETGSAWAGYNFGGGDEFEWSVTPMLGGVFGDTNGIAPGYEGSLGWWKLELYSEGEYLFDFHDSSDSFFYNWSELTLAPLDWFRFGLVTQRTRAYEADRDVQRGLLAGFTFEMIDLAAYVLDPDEGDPIVVASVSVSF